MLTFKCALVSLILIQATTLVIGLTCPPVGPVFPIPTGVDSNHPRIINLANTLNSKIRARIQELALPPFNDNLTSFSAVITTREKSIYEFHYTAPLLGTGSTNKVTGDTAYRVASITKTVTTLAALLQGKCMDDPVTKYVPELRHGPNSGGIHWSRITLKDLASHLAGLARDYANSDLTGVYDNPTAASLGIPPVDHFSFAPCGKNRADPLCTRQQFFRGIKNTSAVYNPADRSSYSNLAFEILGYAIESMTGNTYERVIQDQIFKPLGMTRSGTLRPSDGSGVIPQQPNDWYYNAGHITAAGGIYSTANDLSRFLRGIMNYKILPSHITRNWLKPVSFTSSPTTFYGMPWEIFRTDRMSPVTPDGRIIEILTKSGSLGGYYSVITMVPEFGYGITILTAGSNNMVNFLFNLINRECIPVFDRIAREQAMKTYAGTYTSGNTSPYTSITLAVDDGPGLRITNFISRDVDVWGKLVADTPGKLEARLFPMGVVNRDWSEEWRMMYEISPNQPKQVNGTTQSVGDLFKSNDIPCFGDMDHGFVWAGKSLRSMTFKRRGGTRNGDIVGLELKGFRVSLTK